MKIGRPAFFKSNEIRKKALEFCRSFEELQKNVLTHNKDGCESIGAVVLRAIAAKHNYPELKLQNGNRIISKNKTVNYYVEQFFKK